MLRRLAVLALVGVLLAGCNASKGPIPSGWGGGIRFGTSVDVTTGELQGESAIAHVGHDVAYVGRFRQYLPHGPVRTVATLDGTTVMDVATVVADKDLPVDAWAGTIFGAAFAHAGTFVLRLVDPGNVELARGELTVAP